MPFIFISIAYWDALDATATRASQVSVDNDVPNVIGVSPNDISKLPDGVHYHCTGLKLIEERLAGVFGG